MLAYFKWCLIDQGAQSKPFAIEKNDLLKFEFYNTVFYIINLLYSQNLKYTVESQTHKVEQVTNIYKTHKCTERISLLFEFI